MALHQATRLDSPDKCFSDSNKRGSEVLTVEPAMQTKAPKAMLQPREVLKVLHVGCCTIKSCLQAPQSMCSRQLWPHITAMRRHSLSKPASPRCSILRQSLPKGFERPLMRLSPLQYPQQTVLVATPTLIASASGRACLTAASAEAAELPCRAMLSAASRAVLRKAVADCVG